MIGRKRIPPRAGCSRSRRRGGLLRLRGNLRRFGGCGLLAAALLWRLFHGRRLMLNDLGALLLRLYCLHRRFAPGEAACLAFQCAGRVGVIAIADIAGPVLRGRARNVRLRSEGGGAARRHVFHRHHRCLCRHGVEIRLGHRRRAEAAFTHIHLRDQGVRRVAAGQSCGKAKACDRIDLLAHRSHRLRWITMISGRIDLGS